MKKNVLVFAVAAAMSQLAVGADDFKDVDQDEVAAHYDASQYISVQQRGGQSLPATNRGDYGIAVGVGTASEGLSSIAIGTNTVTNGGSTLAIGTEASSAGTSSISIGEQSNSEGWQATAMGAKSNATDGGATAIGAGASAEAGSASALGSATLANGVNSTAVGSQAQATDGTTTAVGFKANASAGSATAIGSGSAASGVSSFAAGANAKASGLGSVATGMGASSEGDASVAIGRSAKSTQPLSVALGALSETKGHKVITEATVEGIKYDTFAGVPVAVVSVGKEGFERQIVNVAPGEISETSTDAINGSQLYLVAGQVGKNATNIITNANNIAGNTLAIQNNAANIANNATNIEGNKVAINKNAGDIAVNKEAIAVNAKNIATNEGMIIALQEDQVRQDKEIKAAKTEVKAGENVSVVNVPGKDGQNVYTVSAKDTTATVSSKTDLVTVTKGKETKVGGANVTDYAVDLSDIAKEGIARGLTAVQTVKAGENTTVVQNGDVVTVNAKDTQVAAGSAAVTVNNVTTGLNTVATVDLSEASKASLAKADTALQNVNAGSKVAVTKAGDTVTVSALTSEVKAGENVTVAETKGNKGQSVYTVTAKSASVEAGNGIEVASTEVGNNTVYQVKLAEITQQQINANTQGVKNLGSRMNGVESRVDGLSKRIDDVNEVAESAGAIGLAAAQIDRPNEAGKSAIGVAVSGFRSTGALAVGYATNSDDNKWTVKGTLSATTRGHVGAAAGLIYQW